MGLPTDYANPFTPGGKGTRIAATAASQRFALSATGPNLQVANESAQWAYVNTGDNTVTASIGTAGNNDADYPVGPGAVVVITMAPGAVDVAVILESSTGVVICTPGRGN